MCSVLLPDVFLVDFVVEILEAPTQSRFFEFLVSLCKAGPVLQPRGGEH
jgi:hypothetical protein